MRLLQRDGRHQGVIEKKTGIEVKPATRDVRVALVSDCVLHYIVHQQKEAVLVNFKNILFFLSLASAVVISNVYAVDPSICNSGVNVVVHDNGSLKSCELKDDYDANNIRCRNENRISFYNNGSLESCILSTPTTIGENKCDEFALISFYPDGKLKSCMKPSN